MRSVPPLTLLIGLGTTAVAHAENRYSAPDGCPSNEVVIGRLDRMGLPAVQLMARAEAGRFKGVLEITGETKASNANADAGAGLAREIIATSCSEVVDALLFVAQLEAERRNALRVPGATRAQPKRLAEPRSANELPTTGARVRYATLASVGLAAAAGPNVAAELGIGLAAEREANSVAGGWRPQLRGALHWALPTVARSTFNATPVDVAVTSARAALQLCPAAFAVPPLLVAPCLEQDVGVLWASATGFTGAQQSARAWAATGAALLIDVRPDAIRPLFFCGEVSAVAQWSALRFEVGQREAFTTAPVRANATFWLGVRTR
jgi:hypothetical protein